MLMRVINGRDKIDTHFSPGQPLESGRATGGPGFRQREPNDPAPPLPTFVGSDRQTRTQPGLPAPPDSQDPHQPAGRHRMAVHALDGYTGTTPFDGGRLNAATPQSRPVPYAFIEKNKELAGVRVHFVQKKRKKDFPSNHFLI
jgi:hypothetical protein